MNDDECEEWVGWVDIPPKRMVRMRGRVRRSTCVPHDASLAAEVAAWLDDEERGVIVPVIPIDPDIDARVEAMARDAEARMRRRDDDTTR